MKKKKLIKTYKDVNKMINGSVQYKKQVIKESPECKSDGTCHCGQCTEGENIVAEKPKFSMFNFIKKNLIRRY